MNRSSSIGILLAILVLIALFVCLKDEPTIVNLESTPTGANIYLDNKYSGNTPSQVNLNKIKSIRLQQDEPARKKDREIFAELDAAYLPLTANLPLFVALDQGMFEKYGLKVSATETTSPNDIMNGIVSGNIDFAAVLAYTLLFPASQKFPNTFKLFGSTEETDTKFTSSIITLAESTINSVDDLKGKKIGVYTGLVQINFLKAILAGIGISEDEVEIVEISPRLQIQGLVAGQYDALSSTEPTVNIALQQGIAKTVVASPRVKYIMSPFPSTASPISTKLLSENPEAAKAVVWALEDAVDYIRSEPESAVKSLLKYTAIPKENSDAILKSLKLFRFSKIGEENRLNVQRFADYMHSIGLLKQPIADVNDLFGKQEMVDRHGPLQTPD